MNAVTSLPVMLPASAEIFLAIAGMVLLMIGVFRGDSSLRFLSYATIATFAVTAILVVTQGGGGEAFYGLFVSEGFAQFAKILILIGSAFAVLLSRDYLVREQAGRFEFPILILFATLGMMMMVSANDLMSLYMSLELQSLALYVMASIRRYTLKAT